MKKFFQFLILFILLLGGTNSIHSSTSINFKVDKINNTAKIENPDNFKLHQNFPNPFNPSTNIIYTIPEKSEVTLKVFDILGNEIALLVDKVQSKGTYQIEFNADKVGEGLSSGIYLYQLKASGNIQTKKFTLAK